MENQKGNLRQVVIPLLVIASSFCGLRAQTAEPAKATVRIKKVEEVNGVRKVTDTTYTTSDLSSLDRTGDPILIREFTDKDGRTYKTMVVHENIHCEVRDSGAPGERTRTKMVVYRDSASPGQVFRILNVEDELRKEDLNKLMEAGDLRELPGIPPPPGVPVLGSEVLVMEKGETGSDPSLRKVISVRIVKITGLTGQEAERIRNVAGESDEALKLDQISFYPNPGNGRFWLEFNAPEQTKTDIRIINSEGLLVYSEDLGDFTGSYKKEIDLSSGSPGIYFLRISQGEHAISRKLIVE